MKNILRTALLISFLVPLAGHAQAWSVTLYENGNGTAVDSAGNTHILNGQLIADPSGGLAVNVLVYTLPFNFPAGSAGDYVLLEPPNYSSVSDVIRFWTTDNNPGNQVIFYSDKDDPVLAPADTGLPGSYLQNNVALNEVNIGDDMWGVIHSASSPQPGYIGAGLGNYTFISDIPEPGTLAFAGLGFAGLALMAYRRRGK